MPADPSLVVTSPAPLNAETEWPYRIDPFPADTLLGQLGGLDPDEVPREGPLLPNPLRYDLR